MIHKTAIISSRAKIGKNVKIWAHTHVREGAEIGDNTTIGERVYIDHDVVIGKSSKIQNNAQIYSGTIIKDGVFIGPSVVIVNDKYPRAVNFEGKLLEKGEWKQGEVLVSEGASIGAGSIILCDIIIGKRAMVGAGSVVTNNVGDYTLVIGNPAKKVGKVCINGHSLKGKTCLVCGFGQ